MKANFAVINTIVPVLVLITEGLCCVDCKRVIDLS